MKQSSKLFLGAGVTLLVAGGVWMAVSKPDTGLPVTVSPMIPGEQVLTNQSQPARSIRDLLAAIGGIEAEGDELKRAEGLDRFVSTILAADIPGALDGLLGKGRSAFSKELSVRLLARWVDSDPRAAAQWAVRRTTSEGQEEFLGAVATAWARKNLGDAIVWAHELPEDQRNGAILKVAYQAVVDSPLKALELARDLPPTENRDELVSHITSNWASKDPKEAAKWASQIGDQSFRERVLAGIATTWGETDPILAAGLALSSLSPGRQQNDAVMGIVQRWVQKEPAAAAGWVAKFPEGELRQSAAEELVKLWADQNATEASDWLSEMAAGPTKDRAVTAYVGKIAIQQPQTAADWAGKIADETARAQALERVGEAWLLNDESAAREWIKQSALPDTVKERLLEPKSK
jgi:hypothetical protein